MTPNKIMEHLLSHKEDGSDVIGVYPLSQEETCRFLVFDIYNHKKGAERTDEVIEHFEAIDDTLVWHGGMNRWVGRMHGIT